MATSSQLYPNLQRSIHIVAGTAVPQVLLTLYSSDDVETKYVIQGFWQALHVYSRCWVLVEPLDQYGDEYKCRFAASYELLRDPARSFIYLFTGAHLQNLLNAPIVPIEWEIVTDKDGNECPVNVAGRATRPAQESKKCSETPVPALAGTSSEPKSMAKHRECKAITPVDTYVEKIPFAFVEEATAKLCPHLPEGQYPPAKQMPLILVHALHATLFRLVHEQNTCDRERLQEQIAYLSAMMDRVGLWYWDRDNYVQLLWSDDANGVCGVSVGVHPWINRDQVRKIG